MKDLNFVNNISAGVDKLGLFNTPIIFALAKIDWETVEDRDAVLSWMGGEQDGPAEQELTD